MASNKRIRTGMLRHKVTIETPSGVQDKWGEVSKTNTTHATVRASITPISSDEKERGAGHDAEVTHIIRTHWQSGITSKMRIVYGARIFQIKGIPINIEEKNKVLEMTCVEQEVL